MYSSSIVAALPSERDVNSQSCAFLKPILTDLVENLFDNECGDAVSPDFYPHSNQHICLNP